MARKPETQFRTSQVVPFLKTLKNTHAEPIQQKTIRGSADYLLCCNGTPVWLELKRSGGTSEPLQIYKAKNFKRCGGVAVEASPDNWGEVKDLLLKLDRGEKV